MTRHCLFSVFICLFFISCANYQIHYRKDRMEWDKNVDIPTAKLAHRVYFTANLQHTLRDGLNTNIKLLLNELDTAPKNSSLVLLGNNIPSEVYRRVKETDKVKQARANADSLLQRLQNFPGQIHFLPGNEDWKAGENGVSALRRQQKYLRAYFDDKDIMLPGNACGGPEEEKLGKNIVMITVDSQWWLQNWDKEPLINAECDIKNRYSFIRIFQDAIKGNKDKLILVALHHSFYSNGPYGGKFSVGDHLKPLPIIGSIRPVYRYTIGSPQDVAYAHFKEFKRALIGATKKYNNVVFISGHDEILQYSGQKRKSRHYIVSGSGSRASKAARGNEAQFVYGHTGYGQLDYYKNGSIWLKFYIPNKAGTDKKLIYEEKIRNAKAVNLKKDTEFQYNPVMEIDTDSILTSIYSGDSIKSKTYQFLLGKHYRDIYFQPIHFPLLKLDTLFGNNVPYKQGGGFQTKALRITNEKDKEYVMRSLKKNAKDFLPYPFNKTFAVDIVKDQFTAAHPFAAMTVPTMAEAIKVYHTDPKLYYIPKQKGLGKYNRTFGDQLFLVEARPDEDWREKKEFGNSPEIVSTFDVYDEITNSWKNRVDQPWTARSRLFDFVIGDWDRHLDQWRWAFIPDTGGVKNIYRPIPRDRDQVYSRYDGLVSDLARLSFPGFKQLQNFDYTIPKVKWMAQNGRWFDRAFLSELTLQDWEQQVRFIQKNLTDEVIEKAIRENMPPGVFARNNDGISIIAKIKKRRDDLMIYAREFFHLLAKEVTVLGTSKGDYVIVERLPKTTHVKIYKRSPVTRGPELEKQFFDRIFVNKETEAINIFGLSGEDYMEVRGKTKKGTLVRLIGGPGVDQLVDKSHVKGLKKKTHFLDDLTENSIQPSRETKDKRSKFRLANTYSIYEYANDYVLPIPAFGSNPDDGLFLGLGFIYRKHGFKKVPFKEEHRLTGKIALSTLSVDLNYNATYHSVIGRYFGFYHELLLRTPQFTVNYFGKGNESPGQIRDIDFYRTRTSQYSYFPALQRSFRNNGRLMIGLTAQAIDIERTRDRFVFSEDAEVDTTFFTDQIFGGGRARFELSNTNDRTFPDRGSSMFGEAGVKYWFNEKRTIPYFRGMISFFQGIDHKNSMVLATRIGFEHVEGDIPFYESAILSGRDQIRGYRSERFYGNTAFFQNFEFRSKLFVMAKNKLPTTVGIVAGFDYGRVWLDGEVSQKWHYSYGGSLWFSPLNYFTVRAGAFRSEEWTQIIVGTGFFF